MKPTRVKTMKNMDGAEYQVLVVAHGFKEFPVSVYDGRQCYVTETHRVFGGPGRNYHNRHTVYFLDDGSVETIPAGKFNKAARRAPLPAQ
jgi:hypothetical protein